MKRLFLLRHATAAHAGDKTSDFERPLTVQGVQEGDAVARYIAGRGYGVDMLLCSGAARTTQTAGLVLRQVEAKVEYRDNLYLAEVPGLLAAIRGAPAAASSLMIVGHNPGLEACAAQLANEIVPGWHFPPCALAVLDFSVGRWRDVHEGAGTLADFIRPVDL